MLLFILLAKIGCRCHQIRNIANRFLFLKLSYMKKIFLPIQFAVLTATSVSAQKYEYVDVPNTPEGTAHNKGSLDLIHVRFGAYFAPTITWMHPTASTSDDGRYHVTSKGSKVG